MSKPKAGALGVETVATNGALNFRPDGVSRVFRSTFDKLYILLNQLRG